MHPALDPIRELLGDNQLDEALAQLKTLLEHSPRLREALQIAGRHRAAIHLVHQGLVNREDASVAENEIRHALLLLLDDIEAHGDQQPSTVRKELDEEAIRIKNSKNVFAGQANVGGNFHQGDNKTTNNYYQYGSKKIPRILAAPTASVPTGFLGREQELAEIHARLGAGSEALALVNSEGGMGKTTLAARYWQKHEAAYQHLAWLYCERGILSSMVEQLTQPLDLQDAINATAGQPAQQAQVLKTALANLQKPSLLVLDNANEEAEIKSFLAQMQGLGWQVLFTSRCAKVMPDAAQEYPIKSLPPAQARQLFERHYNTEGGPIYEALLHRFMQAIGYNTLCIEIFSKNLAEMAALGLTLADLLKKLEGEGLFLGEDSFNIQTTYTHNVKIQAESSDEVIAALYNLNTLDENQNKILTQFCLLPAENHTLLLLAPLLGLSARDLKKPLDTLVQKGWLITANQAYRCSPVVQKIVLQKNRERLWEWGEGMVEFLDELLEREGSQPKNIEAAGSYAALVADLIANLKAQNDDLIVLYDKLWFFFTATGNLSRALESGELMGEMAKATNNTSNLAISYERLGSTHRDLGNLEQALRFFEDETQFFEERYEAYPLNVEFKHGLAISYEKLGSTHIKLGNLEKALRFFELKHDLSKQLYEAYPQNVNFKDNLAISYQYLGNIHRAFGDIQTTLQNYESMSTVRRELYETYPQNLDFKYGLAISYGKLGSTHMELENLLEALYYFEKFNNLEKELYDIYPQNVKFKKNFAISYQYLGHTHRVLDDLKVALSCFEYFNILEQELYDTYPQDISIKSGLAASYQFLGVCHLELGNLEQSLLFFEQFNQLEKQLYEDYPQNVEFKNGLALSYSKLGSIHSVLNNIEQALRFFEQYYLLEKALFVDNPQNVSFVSEYAESTAVYNGFKQVIGQEKADNAVNESIQIFAALYQKTRNPLYQRKLAICEKMLQPNADLLALIREISSF